ncbi:MAG: Spi family protease inhibitor [Tannerellaceae bacterium]|nr:Spi family protease inhibitor [Tannerellaceae bacterium]
MVRYEKIVYLLTVVLFSGCGEQGTYLPPEDEYIDMNVSRLLSLSAGEVNALKLLHDNNQLTAEEAIQVTGSFISVQAPGEQEVAIEITHAYEKPVRLDEVHPFCPPEENLKIYEMKITRGNSSGFALVTADNRMPVVMAYVPEGNLSDTLDNRGLQWMLHYSQEAAAGQYRQLLQAAHSLLEPTLEKIMQRHSSSKTDVENRNHIRQVVALYVPPVSKDTQRGSEIKNVEEKTLHLPYKWDRVILSMQPFLMRVRKIHPADP